MMKHINKTSAGTIFWLVFVVMLAGLAGPVFGETGKMPGKLVLIKSEKGNIPFSHEEHGKVNGGCAACHSMFPPKGGQIEALKASGKIKDKGVMNMCRDCHGKLMVANTDTGPTADCLGCHKK